MPAQVGGPSAPNSSEADHHTAGFPLTCVRASLPVFYLSLITLLPWLAGLQLVWGNYIALVLEKPHKELSIVVDSYGR